MGPRVCLACAAVHPSRPTCPACGGALLLATKASLDLLLEARLSRQIGAWRAEGLVDDATAERMRALANPSPTSSAPGSDEAASDEIAPGETASPAPLERGVDALFASFAERRRGIAARLAAVVAVADHAATPAHTTSAGGADAHHAVGTGRELFGTREGPTAIGGGLEALVDLDDGAASSREGEARGELKPLLAEYVWWFIGTLLVLAGSVMGVREAWRALAGPPRQVVIASALLAYHGLFLGLAALVARRSALAARVLASIAVGLLPIVFVALAALVAGSRSMGIAMSSAAVIVVIATLRSAGKRFAGAPSKMLVALFVPLLIAELPQGGAIGDGLARAALPFVGVVAAAAGAARLARSEKMAAGLASFVAAMYGAIALGLFALLGVPGGAATGADASALAGGVLFTALLAVVLSEAMGSGPVARASQRLAPTIQIVALAIALGAAYASAGAALSIAPGASRAIAMTLAAVPGVAAIGFALAQRRRLAAIHPAVLLATLTAFLLARAAFPQQSERWVAGCAIVPAALLVLTRVSDRPRRRLLEAWGAGLGLLAIAMTAKVEAMNGAAPLVAAAAAGAVVGIAAHVAGGLRRGGLHAIGGIALLAAGVALFAIGSLGYDASRATFVCAAIATAYGLIAFPHGIAMARRDPDSGERPLDDVSLAIALLGAIVAAVGLPLAPDFAFGSSMRVDARVTFALPALALAAVLLARAGRDRSRAVSFVAALALGSAAITASGGARPAEIAIVLGLCALGSALVASLRGGGAARADARRIAGAIPLPFAATGRALLDGFAAASLVFAARALLAAIGWLGDRVESSRILAVEAGALVVATALVAFITRSHAALRMRGSVWTLAAGGLAAAIAGITNRLGRPLPPAVVGVRLTIIAALIWLLARLLWRFGPRIAERLERPADGVRYHFVAHAGVAALGLVLVIDAWLVGAPTFTRALAVTPPMLLLGGALAAALLFRSFGDARLLHATLAILLAAAPFLAVRRGALGPDLAPLDPPGGRWVLAETLASARRGWLVPTRFLPPDETIASLWSRAWIGVAAFAAIAALVVLVVARARPARRVVIGGLLDCDPEEDHAPIVQAIVAWIAAATALTWAAAMMQPVLPAALLVLAAGAACIAAGVRRAGFAIGAAAAVLVVHAAAHQVDATPTWAGPALAILGLAAVLVSPWIAARRGWDATRTRAPAHAAALFASAPAILYGLASSAPTDSLRAAPQLLANAMNAIQGAWLRAASLSPTLAIVALSLAIASPRWRGGMARMVAAAAVITSGLAAFAGAALIAARTAVPKVDDLASAIAILGPLLALALAAVGALAHVAGSAVHAARPDVAWGARAGRDSLLTVVLVILASFVTSAPAPAGTSLGAGFAALAVASVIALHAALREHGARHVYLLQMIVIAAYALARQRIALPPLADALAALAYGFLLVGVTVLARRRGIPPIATATRRFAALLPLLIALLRGEDATLTTALLAAGSSLLYAVLGAVDRSRIFGSLAALVANGAVLIAALACGFDGVEAYLAPLGLLLLMLTQIFTATLPHAARNKLRVVGALLLYAPAAAKLALQLGRAADGTYSVLFGAVCIFGVILGMLLQIRAYLVMGTFFLTLDVIANLVYAGLRDHRVGFLILSISGLAILGAMITTTLKREEVRRSLRRIQGALRAWE